MAPMPTAIRTAQTVGITASAFAAGSVLSLSYASVAAFMLAPDHIMVRQWRHCFDRGMIVNPSICLVSALSYAFLSYKLYGTLNHSKAEMYALSAICTIGIVPYTMLAMVPTNKKLGRKYDETNELNVGEKATQFDLAKGESTRELVDWWATLNFGRGLLPLMGSVLGLWTTLS